MLGEGPYPAAASLRLLQQALKTGADRTLVTWSIDPQDWLVKDAAKVTASIQNAATWTVR